MKYRKLYFMKATFDIPDELYRQVKARSALQGKTMRSVVVGLLEDWAQVPQAETFPAPGPSPEQLKRYPWLALARKYVRPGVDNSMEGIRESIEKGRAREMNEPIAGPRGTP